MHKLPAPTFLFIDHEDESRQYFAHRLRTVLPDASILEATTGASGLALCRTHRIDCVILELDLPDMSGFEILLSLMPLPESPRIAVVVLTRLTAVPLAQLVRANGAFTCLAKARTSSEMLEEAIRKAIAAAGPLFEE